MMEVEEVRQCEGQLEGIDTHQIVGTLLVDRVALVSPHLKSIRNKCTNKTYQNFLKENSKICVELVKVLKLLQKEIPCPALSSFVQISFTFLSNYITMNQSNQEQLWGMMLEVSFLRPLVAVYGEDRKVVEFYGMMFYNVICKDEKKQGEVVISKEGAELLKMLLGFSVINGQAAEDDAFDWIYLIFKLLIQHIPKYYPLIDETSPSEAQLRILNLLDVTLEENEVIPSPPLVQFLASELEKHISHTFQTKQLQTAHQEAIDHILSILGSISSLALPHINILLTDQGLIKVLLLLMYDESKEVLSQNIWFALKSRAMRILANISFENIKAQNQVREYGGLPLIMNSCLFDQQNPYLREWSVLALRNLCLDNDENQKFVETLKAQGIPEDVQNEMNKLGISLRVGEDGKVKFSRHQKQ